MKMPWCSVCSLILFLFRTNGKKGELEENNFRHCYGIFFENGILKVTSSKLCSKLLLNNHKVHWRYPTVIYGHGSTHMLNLSSRLRQTWNKNRLKCLGKDQLHKKSKTAVQRTLHTPKYITFHLFYTLLFLSSLVFKFNIVLIGIFKSNFQLQNIIMFLFFTKNAYLLRAKITLHVYNCC